MKINTNPAKFRSKLDLVSLQGGGTIVPAFDRSNDFNTLNHYNRV